ncbi:MAG TPA: arylsulfotransferase family protein [Microbacteriaceae bacterium]|nr:arylsulfotransferase family protein [Microbacteriaceae bacterium]
MGTEQNDNTPSPVAQAPQPPRAGLTRRSLVIGGGLAGVVALGVGAGIGVAVSRDDAKKPTPAPSAKPSDGLRHFHGTNLAMPAVAGWRVSDTQKGHLFVTQQTDTMGGKGFRGTIMDDRGEPVWIEPTGANVTGLTVQTFEGKPVLTYWSGTSIGGHGEGVGRILDTSYEPVATVHAGDGLKADLHEFHLTTSGTALVTAYQTIPADLTSIGGPKKGYIYNCHAQEVDIRSGKVLFDWNVNDHVPVSDTYLGLKQDKGHDGTSASRAFDAYHINAIDYWDDMLLVSLRHTHTVYAVSKADGSIRWRLGGKHSYFTVQPDAAFAWQHDARRQPDGTITLFDNHLYSGTNGQSHGKRFRLDETARTATLLTDLTFNRHLGTAMGSVQPMADGHTLVGWGVAPFVTEFDANGEVVYQADLGAMSYRAFRHDWTGAPKTKPEISASTSADTTAVHMSWNGATEIAHWRILAGETGSSLHEVATVPHSHFETLARIAATKAVRAQALDKSGAVLGTTRAIKA